MVEGGSIFPVRDLDSQASTAKRQTSASVVTYRHTTHTRVCLRVTLVYSKLITGDQVVSVSPPGNSPPVGWPDVRVAESDVDSTPFHPEPGRARRQRRRVLRGGPRGRRGRCAHIRPANHMISTHPRRFAPPRGGAVAARRAHNPKVVGSNPTPATTTHQPLPISGKGLVRLTENPDRSVWSCRAYPPVRTYAGLRIPSVPTA